MTMPAGGIAHGVRVVTFLRPGNVDRMKTISSCILIPITLWMAGALGATGCWTTTSSVPLVTDIHVRGRFLVGDSCDLTLTTFHTINGTSQKLDLRSCVLGAVTATTPASTESAGEP